MKKDVCHTSLNILLHKIKPLLSSLLKNNEISSDLNIWLPDFEQKKETIDGNHSTNIIDCVLTGNFLKRIFEVDEWSNANYRLWVLSERTKDVLVNLLNIENTEVQVIPRNKIFNYSEKNIKIEKDKNLNFIFAGRLSPTKNIESLILTTYFLQSEYNINCQLHLIGPTDNISHPDRGVSEYSDYLTGLVDLCNSLSWRFPVIFYKEMAPDTWPEINLPNKVFVNHSTFICEDFNVSLAQVQSLGWPSIISSFGANTDIQRNNSIVMPWYMIGRSDEKIEVKKVKSKFLADYIYTKLDNVFYDTTEAAIPDNSTKLPNLVSHRRLCILKKSLLYNLDFKPDDTIPTDLVTLIQNKKGIKFFSKYRLYFGQLNFDDSVSIILNDNIIEQLLNIVPMKIELSDLLHRFKGKKIFFISFLQLNLPENLFILANSNLVYVPFAGKLFDSYFKFVKDLTPLNCEIISLGNL